MEIGASSSSSSPFFVGISDEDRQNHTSLQQLQQHNQQQQQQQHNQQQQLLQQQHNQQQQQQQISSVHAAPEITSMVPVPPPPVPPTQKKKRNLPGTPNPDAEVIALSPKTLMATNRFICEVCKKGFQREQNLQLHRRGHNLPWKLRQKSSKDVKRRVYLCPEPSCVHHDPSRALGDLTGIKKHFCRKHGEKKWKCDKCSKRYAVQSDWKAHAKTCGTREYRCDCGTMFSRRDSFITHRAFCDALAQESARLPAGSPATVGNHHLYLNNSMGLSLPHLNNPRVLPSLHNQTHPSADILRLGGGVCIGEAATTAAAAADGTDQFDVHRPSTNNFFHFNTSMSNQHHNFPEEQPQSQSLMFRNNRQFLHGLMHLPDVLQANSPGDSANFFNHDFLSNSSSHVTTSLSSSRTSGCANNHNQQHLHLVSNQFDHGGAGEVQQSYIFAGNQMGSSGMSSIYRSPIHQGSSGSYEHSLLPQISATALLQKAGQMGAATGTAISTGIRCFNGSSSSSSASSFGNNTKSTSNFAREKLTTIGEEVGGGGGGMRPHHQLESDVNNFQLAGLTRDFLGVGGVFRRGVMTSSLERDQIGHHPEDVLSDIGSFGGSEMNPGGSSSTTPFPDRSLQ